VNTFRRYLQQMNLHKPGGARRGGDRVSAA
jgi:hypothetical protein